MKKSQVLQFSALVGPGALFQAIYDIDTKTVMTFNCGIPLIDIAITNLLDIFPFRSRASKCHTNGVKQ